MRILLTITLVFTLLSCKVEPEAIQYGKDGCSHCKMTLVDKKFGAELVTGKGKVFKFDDVNCMLSVYNSSESAHEEFSHVLAVDFSQPGRLIDARNAFYLKSSKINSPMGSQTAAFEKKESLDEVKKQFQGIYLVWGELVSQFK